MTYSTLSELYAATAKERDELRAELDANRWVSVEDALPEEFKPVLVYRRNKAGEKVVEAGHYCGKRGWKTVGQPSRSVTHWMPLPEGPKE